MKRTPFFALIMLATLVGMLTGCERYDIASITIHQDAFNDTTRLVAYTAQVTDDGGCARCIEAGYCFSYIDAEPSHTCFYSTVVPMVRDSMMAFTDSTQYLTFQWQRQLPFIETAGGEGSEENDTLLYFFRSYITTNAGTFYSAVDTVKVPRSY